MTNVTNPSVRGVLDSLRKDLDCSDRVLANFLGLGVSVLREGAEGALNESATDRLGKRLHSLHCVVRLLAGMGASPVAIKESIQQFVYEDSDGFSDSVISAIASEKYRTNVLVTMAKMGFNKYMEKLAARSKRA